MIVVQTLAANGLYQDFEWTNLIIYDIYSETESTLN